MKPMNKRRTTLSAVAASSLLLLAACGGDTQPAGDASDDSSSSSEGGDDAKTVVFSPLSLEIPAMQGLSEGMTGYGGSKGYDIVVQDPNYDPQKQATDLESVISSGRAAGAWVISIEPSALKQVVSVAAENKVPLVLNGLPEAYGLDGPGPGLTFSTIDYEAQGTAIGEELGNCINEKLDGAADVLFQENAPGYAGKEELEAAAKAALASTAPDAEIVANIVANDRAQAQTDTGSSLQGNPDVTAVLAFNDEGALGALGAYKAAGKELPCLTEAGGNDEVLGLVESGEIYASVALDFEGDLVAVFDNLTAMMADPTIEGEQLVVPQNVVKADS